jgi:carbonic anhydrase
MPDDPGRSAVLRLDEVSAANSRYAATFNPPWREAAPRARVAIVTCMDCRILPLAALGLRQGDAHVLRNAGARVTPDMLRSLVISQRALGTDTVIVMPHTRCGLTGLDPSPWREELPADAPPLDFMVVHDPRATCLDDVGALRASPWMRPDTRYWPLLYDVDTGRITVLA